MIFSCVLLEHVLTFRRLVLIVLRSTNHHHPSYTSYLADMKLNVKRGTDHHTFSYILLSMPPGMQVCAFDI